MSFILKISAFIRRQSFEVTLETMLVFLCSWTLFVEMSPMSSAKKERKEGRELSMSPVLIQNRLVGEISLTQNTSPPPARRTSFVGCHSVFKFYHLSICIYINQSSNSIYLSIYIYINLSIVKCLGIRNG